MIRSRFGVSDPHAVSPGKTTSGIPPTALATTGVSQAIASRLMMPNGSCRAGASAIIPEDISPAALVAIVRRVAEGEDLISAELLAEPALASRIVNEFRKQAPHAAGASPLTARETEVLDAIATGMRNKDVALALSIREQTVKNHVGVILRKLSVRRRTQAVVQAMRQGWIGGR